MSKIQKKAVARLIIVIFLFSVSVAIVFFNRQVPLLDVLGWLGFMWLLFTPALIDPPPFIPLQKKGKIVFDERDERILQKATAQAFGAFWYVFPILCLAIYIFTNVNRFGTISSNILTLLAGGGALLVTLVQSISILIQYRNRGSVSNE
jgi:hypothetical protein